MNHRLPLALLLLMSLPALGETAEAPCITLLLSQSDGSITPSGAVTCAEGAKIDLRVISTDPACNDYLVTGQTEVSETGRFAERDDVRDLTIRHSRRFSAYLVEVKPKSPVPDGCPANSTARQWRIPVYTPSWQVGIAGAFTINTTTDRRYSLRPVAGTDPQKLAVHRDSDLEDKASVNAAGLIHVYHDRSGNEGWEVGWVPLAVGFSYSSDVGSSILLGTGLRLGTVAFITGGVSLSKSQRLSGGLQEGQIVSAGTQLSTTGRTTLGAWLGLSFAFLSEKAKPTLEAAFPQKQ